MPSIKKLESMPNKAHTGFLTRKLKLIPPITIIGKTKFVKLIQKT